MSANEQNANAKDLNDLLDSALEDFENPSTNGTASGGGRIKAENGTTSGDKPNPDDTSAFFIEQANILAESMNTMFKEAGDGNQKPSSDQIIAGFKKMAEAAAATLQGESQANDEEVAKYSDSIAEALKGLREGTDNLAASVSEADVANMFTGLNMDGQGSDDGNMFMPFMEGMMQSLLSAEILLPSIKELIAKYPKYLEENGDKILLEDKERYEKQLELYKVICTHLESESASDTPQVRREKFKIILEDMRKLQDYGQPPEEIIAETGELPSLDPSIVPSGSGPQCPTM